MTEDYSNHLNEITKRAEPLPPSQTYTLPELFENEWNEFIDGISPNALGQAYASAIAQGLIRHSRFHSVDRSPRMNRYIRIEETKV